jgi:YVTN family beta-propeller protein
VLSIPASWGQEHKTLLRAAAHEAHLPEPAFVARPVAAASHLAATTKRGRLVAVVDAGPDGVEVAVLRRTLRGFELTGQPGSLVRSGREDQKGAVRRPAPELAGLLVQTGASAGDLSGVYLTGQANTDAEIIRVITETVGTQVRFPPNPVTAAAFGAVEQAVARKPGRTTQGSLRLPGGTALAAATAVVALAAIAGGIALHSRGGTQGHPTPPTQRASAQGHATPPTQHASTPSRLPPISSPGHAGVYVISVTGAGPAFMREIDPSDNAVGPALNVGTAHQVVFSPKGGYAYLVGRGAATRTAAGITLTPFDAATGTLGRPLLVAGFVNSQDFFAFAPDGKTAYVLTAGYRGLQSDTSAVTIVNTVTNTLGRSIVVPGDTDELALSPDGGTLYVTYPGSDTTGTPGWVIPVTAATGSVGKEIPAGDNPDLIAITPDGKTAYVTNVYSSSVTPISTATNTPGAAIHVCSPQEVVMDIAITPDGKTAYVLCAGGTSGGSGDIYAGAVTPVSTATDVAGPAIPITGTAISIAVAPDGEAAYVVCGSASSTAPGTVTRISTTTNTAAPPVTVGWDAGHIVFGPDGKTAYVDGQPGENADASSIVTPIDVATNNAGHPIELTGGLSGIAARPSSG